MSTETTEPKQRKESVRSVTMQMLKDGKSDQEIIEAIKTQFNWEEKRIKASLIVHKGVINRAARQQPVAPPTEPAPATN